MKRKILFSILALMLFIQIIPVDAYSIIKEEIGFGHGHLMQSGEEYASRIFYSNYTKHFYSIFAMIGPGGISYSVYYSYSPDGINWAQSDRALHPISFPGALNVDGVNDKIDFYMTPDGKHIYFVHEDEYDSTELRWGKVSLNKTTSRLMQNVSSTTIMEGAYGGASGLFGTKVIDDSYSIVVDEDGYVFIGFEAFLTPGNQYFYFVIKSNSPDHFNYEDFGDHWMMEQELGGGLGNDGWHGRVFPVHGGEDIAVIGNYYDNAGTWEHHYSMWYDQSIDDWITIGGLFNDQEGGTWRDEQWDIGWSSDLAVFFKQDESKTVPDRIELDALFLNEVTMIWENRTDISFEELGDPGPIRFLPLVSVREGTNAVNFVWSIAGNDTIWERRMFPNGTLEEVLIGEPGNLRGPVEWREHDVYDGALPWVGTLSINGNDEVRTGTTVGGYGDTYLFWVVNRAWLNGKYIRFKWYLNGIGDKRTQYFRVMDGTYDRESDTDFPAGGAIATKGNGELFSFQNDQAVSNWYTKDFQIDTSGGSEENVTIMFMTHDAWGAQVRIHLDWYEVNTGSGGANNLFLNDFNDLDVITQERVATQSDYSRIDSPEYSREVYRIFESFEDDYFTIAGSKISNDPNGQGPSPVCWFVDGGQIEKYWWQGNGDYILTNYSLFLESSGEEEDWEPIYTHISTTLYDAQGNELSDNWIFEGEVYDLVSVVKNVTSFDVQFSDTIHNITFKFNNGTDRTWVEVTPADQFTVGLAWSNITRDGTETTIRWRFIPDRSIVDAVNQTWAFFIENSFYGVGMWGSPGILTHIYNLGGFTYYTFTGDGGRVTGGQPFELYATNGTDGSTARAEQYYRKLQSVHFLLEIDMDNAWNEVTGEFDIPPGVGWIDIGIDYRQNGSWTEWSKVRIYVQSADVGHHNGGTDHNWIEWSVDWYNFLPGPNTSQNIRSDLITSNHWGYENENLDPDYYNRTSSQLWVDLWFDRTNASTTIGGQVNSMYHGMKEHGSAWWFGYGTFQPMISDYGNAMFLDDLYDYTGNVTGSMNYDLMRFYIEVGKVADPDQGDDDTWTIRAIENLNRKQADDRMQGVEIPSFEPTLVLDMPMFQSSNPLLRAIDGISRSIWMGALGFIKILWGAMDTIFEWAGFGAGFFSILSQFVIETIPDLIIVIMQNLSVLVISFVDIIESIFNLLVVVVPTYVIGLGWLAESLIDYWRAFSDIFAGGIVDFSIIDDLALGSWISFGITMLPFYEIWTIIWSKDVSGRLKERFEFYSALFGGLLSFFRSMVSMVGELVQAIRSFLPI